MLQNHDSREKCLELEQENGCRTNIGMVKNASFVERGEAAAAVFSRGGRLTEAFWRRFQNGESLR